jgi:hypothetical protein
MASDPVDQAVLLFGGVGTTLSPALGARFDQDTWLWNGQNWLRVPMFENPPTRAGALLEPYGNSHLVLFGGFGPADHLTDTWIYGRVGG